MAYEITQCYLPPDRGDVGTITTSPNTSPTRYPLRHRANLAIKKIVHNRLRVSFDLEMK